MEIDGPTCDPQMDESQFFSLILREDIAFFDSVQSEPPNRCSFGIIC